MTTRLPIDYKGGSSPLPKEPAERFTEDELQNRRRDFSLRFKSLFPGMNDTEIGRQLKTASPVIKNYVDGTRFPNTEMLLEIRRSTRVNLDWLLTGEGDRFVDKSSLFTDDEEKEILEFAATNRLTLSESVHKLTMAALNFLNFF